MYWLVSIPLNNSVWRCLVVAARRVAMDTSFCAKCHSAPPTLRHKGPNLSIVDEFNYKILRLQSGWEKNLKPFFICSRSYNFITIKCPKDMKGALQVKTWFSFGVGMQVISMLATAWISKRPLPEDMHLLISPIVLFSLLVTPDFCKLNISVHDQVQLSLYLPLAGEPIEKKHPFILYAFCNLDKHFTWVGNNKYMKWTSRVKLPYTVKITDAQQKLTSFNSLLQYKHNKFPVALSTYTLCKIMWYPVCPYGNYM